MEFNKLYGIIYNILKAECIVVMGMEILEWIHANLHGSNFANQLFKYITYLADYGIVWLLLGVVLFFIPRTRKAGFMVLVGFVGVSFVNHYILKAIVNSPRPFVKNPQFLDFIKSINMFIPDSSSFPSGHAAVSFSSAVILTMMYKSKGAWAFLPAVIISFSRVFLCVHYPMDVIGGAMIGIIVGIVSVIGCNMFFKYATIYLDKRKQNKINHSSTKNSI